MNIKKILCSAALCCLLANTALAATVPADSFSKDAETAGLKVRNYKNTDVMGTEKQGIYVKYSPQKLYGSTGFGIYCYDNLDDGILYMAIGLDPRSKIVPVPKTVVINDNGKRVDIPVQNYKREDGYASLIGYWSEFQVSIPLSVLKAAGVKSLNGISILMMNPETGVDSNAFEPILVAKQEKAIVEATKVYNFYLKISEAMK